MSEWKIEREKLNTMVLSSVFGFELSVFHSQIKEDDKGGK